MKLKQIVIYLGIGLGVGVILMLFLGKVFSSHWEKKYNQDIGVLTEKLANLEKAKKEGDAIIAQNKIVMAEEKEKREESEAREKKLKEQQAAILAENEHLHAQLTMLPNDKLAIEIGNYIGQENVTVWMQGFTLTRIGGERTVGIFYDKTMYFNLAENRLKQLGEKDNQINSWKVSFEKSEINFTTKENEANQCADALKQSLKTNDDLRKVMRWKKIENFGKGALAGGTIVFLLKIAKVI